MIQLNPDVSRGSVDTGILNLIAENSYAEIAHHRRSTEEVAEPTSFITSKITADQTFDIDQSHNMSTSFNLQKPHSNKLTSFNRFKRDHRSTSSTRDQPQKSL